MASDDFKKDVQLDQYDLVRCAVEQPELYAEWAEKWAIAVRYRDSLKDKLAVTRSNCDSDIREDPAKFGWKNSAKSPTEAFISSAIIAHPDYKLDNEEYQDACHDVNIMSIAKEAFEHRLKALVILKDLYTSSYYSGNKKFDSSYQEAMPEEASKQQTSNLEKNTRLVRRSKPEDT